MSHPVAKPRRIAGIAAIGVATLLLISAVGLKPGSASGHAAGTVVSATAAAPAAVAPGSADGLPWGWATMTTDAAGLPAEPPSRRVDPALTPANRSGPSTARTRQAVAARGEGQPPLSRRLRLVIADSNPIMRHGLRGVVEDGLPARVVAEARGGVEVLATVARTRPHAVVLDVRTPPCDRLDALPRLARLTRVIAISHNADPYLVTQALAGGAVAFLVHGEYSTRQLIRAVAYARQADIHLSSPTAAGAAHRTDRAALQPSPPAASATRDQLSPRERQVMDGVARGLTNSEIARSLGVSEKTVKNHINRIFAKLQVTTRGRAIVLWLNAGAAGRMP